MRTFAAVGVAMALGASALAAQYERRYEVGAFAAFTKYDKAFGLDNKLGGGVRFAYALRPTLSLEVEALFQPPHDIGPSTQIEPVIGGGSLVFNALNRGQLAVYLLGGYSRLDFGATNPYRFTDGAAHAGAGARFFLSPRLALRVEARGIYTPETNASFGQKNATHLVGSVGLALFQPDRAPATAPAPTPEPVAAAAPPAPLAVPPPPPESDSDGDGVPDGRDACPDTPLGATVDAMGCPVDSDGDGVADGIDRCPSTVAGTPVDATGCPADSDKDGVPDSLDRCPNTPAGMQVDANGCPIAKDSDGDGVIDPQDRCPNTPAGSRVDEFGCLLLFEERAPAATPGAPAPRPTLILRGVNFQSGRSVLTATSYQVLDQVAGSLIANPEIRIEIAGYTDNTGSLALNRRLSGNRAIAVRFYLARKGVSPSRMIARGYGPTNPVASNATPDGRAQNRRVELHKLP